MDLSVGMRVIIRDEEWLIENKKINPLGEETIYCKGISPFVREEKGIFLVELEGRENIQVIDPKETKFVSDSSSHFLNSLLYLEGEWRKKIPTDEEIHIGKKGAMNLMDFQLVPAEMCLKKPRQRILIADTVGLGKTLEAGILMSELIARGKGKRILVLAQKAMLTQIQKEMWNRFTIPLVSLDSQAIKKIRQEWPSNRNPFNYYDKTIISIDTLKQDVEYSHYLETARWDIILIDEAQNIAQRGTKNSQRSILGEKLRDRSDTMILLSATPHDGTVKSFVSLIKLLDLTAVQDENNINKDTIKNLCIRRNRNKIINELNSKYTKVDSKNIYFEPSNEEENLYEKLVNIDLYYNESGRRKASGGSELFKTTLIKSAFSSHIACRKTAENHIKTLEKKGTAEANKDIEKLKEIIDLSKKINETNYNRYQKLLETLTKDNTYNWDKNNKNDRLVIFTERVSTMEFLLKNLKKDLGLNDNEIVSISGSQSDVEQEEIVENFGRSESPLKILVASNVASEGLNLHYFCHRLIHFDLPWSIMTLEQRNGRIDRYGQEHQPIIRYMYINSKNKEINYDSHIMEKLLEKNKNKIENLGDGEEWITFLSSAEEENSITEAMEKGKENNFDADIALENMKEEKAKEEEEQNNYTPALDELLKNMNNANSSISKKSELTLFTDKDFLLKQEFLKCEEQTNNDCVRILKEDKNTELFKRFKSILPSKALENDYIELSPDKDFMMEKMKDSLLKSLNQYAWPDVQYMWANHPVYDYIINKTEDLFGRGEAPVIRNKSLGENIIYVMSGILSNKRGTPVSHELFGIEKSGVGYKVLKIEDVRDNYLPKDLSNPGTLSENSSERVTKNLSEAVDEAIKYMNDNKKAFEDKKDKIEESELNRLEAVEKRINEMKNESKITSKQKDLNNELKSIIDYINNSLKIEGEAYIKVICAITGE